MEVVLNEVNNIINTITYYLYSFGFIGGFLLVFIESFMPILPFGLFVGLNIKAFGAIFGYSLSYVATLCGAFVLFLFFRHIVKRYFINWYKKRRNSKKVDYFIDKVTHSDFNVLVVIMSIPFFPTFFVNVAAGLSDISWKKYLLVLALSKISATFFWGYVGKSFLDSIKDPKILLIVVALVLIAYVLSKIAEKIFDIKE